MILPTRCRKKQRIFWRDSLRTMLGTWPRASAVFWSVWADQAGDGDPNTAAGSCSRAVCGGFVRRGGGLWPGNRRKSGHSLFAHGGGPLRDAADRRQSGRPHWPGQPDHPGALGLFSDASAHAGSSHGGQRCCIHRHRPAGDHGFFCGPAAAAHPGTSAAAGIPVHRCADRGGVPSGGTAGRGGGGTEKSGHLAA